MRGLLAVFVVGLAALGTTSPINEWAAHENILRDDLEENESIGDHINRVNSAEGGDLFEGDIVMAREPDGSGRAKRNAQRARQYLWSGRVVPYDFDSSLPDEIKNTVLAAIEEYHSKTCLRFVPRSEAAKNWVHFTYKSGCWSSVGKQYWTNGGQDLSLGQGCNNKGTVMHEMMHAIGFWHEQSRPDRNQYVEVLWENIVPGKEHNFKKYSHGNIDRLQVPYDYSSIMHYGKKSFSTNGLPTIRSIKNVNQELGQRDGFTANDKHEINLLYDCSNQGKGWSSWSEYGACDLRCSKIRQRFCTSDNPDLHCPSHDIYNVETQTTKCTPQECNAAIDGHWGRWSSWGSCSSTCGEGTQIRTRKCDDPEPAKGGKPCAGESKMSQQCTMRTCGLGPDDCEFDNDGFCFWKNPDSATGYFRWQRRTGSTPTGMTGPSGDHTHGSGHYLFVEASSPSQPGDEASLLSRTFPQTPARCLSFWYHMYGPGIGALAVYKEEGSGNVKRTELWKKSGPQDDQWIHQEITLHSAADYKIVFQATRGPDFMGDIALDDVSFRDHPCSYVAPPYKLVGCFRDKKKSRAIPMLKNLRGNIDWNNLDAIIAQCYELAKQEKYKIFAIQYYGECRSGSGAEATYAKYGEAANSACAGGVGGPNANAVYQIEA